MSRRARSGFTLVELLVVVTIIGMLVALLLPAVNAVRRAARLTECMNNQKELGQAVLQYANAKDQFPALIGPSFGAAPISWVVAVFPYMGREDLWKEWRDGDGTLVQLNQLICGEDAAKGAGELSYVANANRFPDRLTTPSARTSLSDVPSAQSTIMIAERTVAVGSYPVAGKWTMKTVTDKPALSFTWDPAPTSTKKLGEYLSSNHPAGVNLIFCDGHGETLKPDALCNLYGY